MHIRICRSPTDQLFWKPVIFQKEIFGRFLQLLKERRSFWVASMIFTIKVFLIIKVVCKKLTEWDPVFVDIIIYIL